MTHPAALCPTCLASPGRPCTSPNGSQRKPHRTRLQAAGLDVPTMGRPRSEVRIKGTSEQVANLEALAAGAGVSVSTWVWSQVC